MRAARWMRTWVPSSPSLSARAARAWCECRASCIYHGLHASGQANGLLSHSMRQPLAVPAPAGVLCFSDYVPLPYLPLQV